MSKSFEIYVVSDGTGETADQLLKAVLVNYLRDKTKVVRYKNVRTERHVSSILENAARSHCLMVYTFISRDLRKYTHKLATELGIDSVDLLGGLFQSLDAKLEKDPNAKPGLFHQVNEYYFKRIEAIEFTVKHDDGRYTENLRNADIVLVGLSRTSKTPLSVYLSYKGFKVANVPIVLGIALPEVLQEINQHKIIGLIIEPHTLVGIRRERLLRMGEDPTGSYASLEHVVEEIEYAKEIFRKNRRWPVFDVTGKALEETATEVEKVIRSNFPGA